MKQSYCSAFVLKVMAVMAKPYEVFNRIILTVPISVVHEECPYIIKTAKTT